MQFPALKQTPTNPCHNSFHLQYTNTINAIAVSSSQIESLCGVIEHSSTSALISSIKANHSIAKVLNLVYIAINEGSKWSLTISGENGLKSYLQNNAHINTSRVYIFFNLQWGQSSLKTIWLLTMWPQHMMLESIHQLLLAPWPYSEYLPLEWLYRTHSQLPWSHSQQRVEQPKAQGQREIEANEIE